jgi:PIN domain nuclease of toxin-antitoxin system
VNLLLDTHVFLWWDRDDARLNPAARSLIEDPTNTVFVSAASVWEIAIKRRVGKLAFSGSPTAAIAANGFLELPIEPADAEHAGNLDWAHNDPFDRVLVSQAIRKSATFVTADALIRDFRFVPQLWSA